jgi:hypothetical protein
MSVFLLILWAFGVSYITFGDKAPGEYIGNLFFGTWISFVLVLQATAANLRNMFFEEEDSGAPAGEAKDDAKVKGDTQV